MLPESHRFVAQKLSDEIQRAYGPVLNEERLLWYAVAPDFLPKYKLRRHYREYSLSYVVKSIVQLIWYGRAHRILTTNKKKVINEFSKRLGVISHYLMDFVTYPHAKSLTYNGTMRAHVQYEKLLNQYIQHHEFENKIVASPLLPTSGNPILLYATIYHHLERLFDEYDQCETSFATDLNYALEINLRMVDFCLACSEVPVGAPVHALTPIWSKPAWSKI